MITLLISTKLIHGSKRKSLKKKLIRVLLENLGKVHMKAELVKSVYGIEKFSERSETFQTAYERSLRKLIQRTREELNEQLRLSLPNINWLPHCREEKGWKLYQINQASPFRRKTII